MPFPTLVFFVLAVGLAAAQLGGTELRLSPRHAMLTSCFKAYALFVVLLALPVSSYFYVFHGDWFLLYSLDVRRIPSAIALLGFALQAALGALGFLAGAALSRAQRSGTAYVAVGVSAILALAVVPLFYDRLSVVGTFSQYHGDFGLRAYGGALMQGGLCMGFLLASGATYLLLRILASSRRSA